MTSFGSVRVRTPLALPGMRIGLMGGSFNPAHEGHLAVAETALKRLGLDRVWWIVSPGNPLKSHAGLAPLADRLAAARRLTGSDPRIEVTGFEAALGSPYTAVTVGFLVRRHPGVRFVWIMGADNLAGLDRWQAWREIARMVPLAVVDRPDWRMKSIASMAVACEGAAPRVAGEPPRSLSAARLGPARDAALSPVVDRAPEACRPGPLMQPGRG
jgi:nicotinate-nucleotide adenylyltransferase